MSKSRKSATEWREHIIDKMMVHSIRAEHNEEGHFYRYLPTDTLMPSVTAWCGLLSADVKRLEKWSARMAAERVMKKFQSDMGEAAKKKLLKEAVMAHVEAFVDAGDVGTRIHSAVELYCREWMTTGERPADARTFNPNPDDWRVTAGLRSFEKFCIENDAVPVMCELLVASPKYGYAGTLDLLMLIGGRLVLVDLKSSNSISDKPAYVMQTVSYRHALKELTEVGTERIIILRLDKGRAEYDVEEVPKDEWASAFTAFRASGGVYRWLKNGNAKSFDLFARKKVLV